MNFRAILCASHPDIYTHPGPALACFTRSVLEGSPTIQSTPFFSQLHRWQCEHTRSLLSRMWGLSFLQSQVLLNDLWCQHSAEVLEGCGGTDVVRPAEPWPREGIAEPAPLRPSCFCWGTEGGGASSNPPALPWAVEAARPSPHNGNR